MHHHRLNCFLKYKILKIKPQHYYNLQNIHYQKFYSQLRKRDYKFLDNYKQAIYYRLRIVSFKPPNNSFHNYSGKFYYPFHKSVYKYLDIDKVDLAMAKFDHKYHHIIF